MKKSDALKKKKDATKSKKSPKKKTDAKKTKKNTLIKELTTLIKDINEEGLKFLINQARIIIHNIKVEEQNIAIQKSTGKAPAAGKPAKPKKPAIDIEEAPDSSYFIIIMNNARNFFSLEEMRKVVKICHASSDDKDASIRLHNWFSRERSDVLKNTGIGGVNDPALAVIYKFIIRKYKVKDNK